MENEEPEIVSVVRTRKKRAPVEAAPPKKGNASWKPAGSRLVVANREDGYAYKWFSVAGDADAGADRIEVAREEGWEVVSGISGSSVIAGERALSSVRRVGTLRLMKTPIENSKAREAYFADQTNRQTMRPAQRARMMLSEDGGPYNPDSVITDEGTRRGRYPTRHRTR